MSRAVPPVLSYLLSANGQAAREVGWSEFVDTYSRLLLHVARGGSQDHDGAMDRYAYVLEQLRHDDCRRLRTYVADGRSEFSTWLVVVAQRLCLDHRRQRFGRLRAQPDDADAREEHAARRRLVNLIGAEIDLSTLADQDGTGADETVRVTDIHRALQSALQQLGPRDRLLIKLRFEDELPMPEVAQSLGLPTRFHAYRRLTEVLGLLREAMERSGFREGSP